jgi:hypothetical protein
VIAHMSRRKLWEGMSNFGLIAAVLHSVMVRIFYRFDAVLTTQRRIHGLLRRIHGSWVVTSYILSLYMSIICG